MDLPFAVEAQGGVGLRSLNSLSGLERGLRLVVHQFQAQKRIQGRNVVWFEFDCLY